MSTTLEIVTNIKEIYEWVPEIQKMKCKRCNPQEMNGVGYIKTTQGNTTGLHVHAKAFHKIVQDGKKKKLTPSAGAQVAIPTPFSSLDSDFPLHAMLARMTSLDGIAFQKFQSSVDLRLAVEARLEKIKCSIRLPESDTTIRDYVMDYCEKAQDIVKEEILTYVQSQKFCSIDFDEWTSIANKRYINISVFGEQSQLWNLGLVKLEVKGNATNVWKLVSDRLKEYNITSEKHVCCMTTDGASVMKKVGKDAPIEQQLCILHGIQLAIVDILYKTESKKAKKKKADEEKEEDETEEGEEEENKNEEDANEEDENEEDENEEDDEEQEEEPISISVGNTDSVENSDDENGGMEVERKEIAVDFKNESVDAAVKKVRKICCLFRRSPTKNKILQKYNLESFGKELQMELDVQTRWSSLLKMLDRYWHIKSSVAKALIDAKLNISMDENENFIIFSLLKTLKPVAQAVETLSGRNIGLLEARSVLKLLFSQLESQKNAFAKKVTQKLRIRISQRWTINSSLLWYLHTGLLYDDTAQIQIAETRDFEQDEKAYDMCTFSFMDSDSQEIVTETHTDEIFAIPSRAIILNHMMKLLNRVGAIFPPSAQTNTVSEDSVDEGPSSSKQLRLEKPTFQDLLKKAVTSASNVPVKKTNRKPLDLKKILTKEMSVFEENHNRGPNLMRLYNMFKTVRAHSVESERAFSSSANIVTKIRSRLNDETIDSLCFLRSLFRNLKPNAN